MNRRADDRKFIIAYNPLHPQQSKMLTGEITGSSREAYALIDTSSFVGQGIELSECRIIDSFESAQEDCCEIVFDGKPTIFETRTILDYFFVIEGEVAAGIYKFYDFEDNYYEIKDAAALSKFFNAEAFDYENHKFVCRPDRISIYDIKTNREVRFFEKYPFSFFDVYCPLCRQKVVTYQLDSCRSQCEVLMVPCPHLAGNAVLHRSFYESEALDDLDVNYDFIDGDIYFETADGWQKPIIFVSPYQPLDSHWGGADDDGFADHFFFMKTERHSWIK